MATDGGIDGGLVALATILAVHGRSVAPDQLRHEFGAGRATSAADLIRLARRQDGVSARLVATDYAQLGRLSMPLIAAVAEGWIVIGRVAADGLLVQKADAAPERMARDAFLAQWTGEVVLVRVRARDGDAAAANLGGAGWFLPQVLRYRRLIGEVLLISLAINLLGLAAPLFFQNVIDRVLVYNSLTTLKVLAFGFAAISVWEVLFGWLRTRLYSETGQKMDVELGSRLFRHLLGLPIAYFESRRVGDTVTRIRQLETIREFLTNASLSVFVDPLFTIVFLAAMWFYSPALIPFTLLTLAGYAAISFMVTPGLRRRLDAKFDRGSASNALLVESVTNMQTIKSAAVEPQWRDHWETRLAAYSAASQRVISLANSGSQAVQLVSKLGLAAILYFGAREVIDGTLTIGGLVAFNMLAQRLSSPMIRMAQLWQDFQQVRVSIQRLGDITGQPLEPGTGMRLTLARMNGSVRFENVSFRYGLEGPLALQEIDFAMPAGSSLGIAGTSGSGKSTLAKLLQRLYTPTTGRILVDGIDVAQADPAWLRRQIGVVLQDALLFNRTVRENIALADPAMPMERVIGAAHLAGAHDFITRLPQGYETALEERGANLSGGQRQRIAIARALVTQPRILILDEATSALDIESEELIQRNLRTILRGRTVLIIAHRLSALRQCDRIMMIEQGRIVEAGTHEELLRAQGRYASLHRRQTGAMQ